MKCIDTYELIRNKTIRFITNPYFEGKRTSSNSQLGKEKRESTSTLLQEHLEDYDYNQGKITYRKISQDLNISERTVKRYLKDRHLREIYDIVKAKSKR
jgi:response regulator of citrate/malate metabolism